MNAEFLLEQILVVLRAKNKNSQLWTEDDVAKHFNIKKRNIKTVTSLPGFPLPVKIPGVSKRWINSEVREFNPADAYSSPSPEPIAKADIPWISRTLTGKQDILRAINVTATNISDHIKNASGVYFLLMKREVVYVGQSTNCFCRIVQHIRDQEKEFDRVCYMRVPVNELLVVESDLIALFNPKYNTRKRDAGTMQKNDRKNHAHA